MSKLKPPSKIGKPTGLPHPKPSGGIPAPSSSRGQSKCRLQKKKKKKNFVCERYVFISYFGTSK